MFWGAAWAILVLAAGGGLLYRQAIRPPAATPPAVELDPGGDVVEEALRLAGIDSLAARGRWVDEVPGVDLAALPPARREVFLRFANARRCTCDCGYTLAGCRNFDASCETSAPSVAALYDSVRAGFIRIADGVRERPARGG
ncbi:MAG: hypothetical protein A2W00_12920 [Candidatus Eisenbacteria bacterium RBG_16_71_46]|nr:MAG: hypothetical protein A2W00_12920 [Candidatus Eisenbacteria bacterium RBG_16_71_46]